MASTSSGPSGQSHGSPQRRGCSPQGGPILCPIADECTPQKERFDQNPGGVRYWLLGVISLCAYIYIDYYVYIYIILLYRYMMVYGICIYEGLYGCGSNSLTTIFWVPIGFEPYPAPSAWPLWWVSSPIFNMKPLRKMTCYSIQNRGIGQN